MGKVLLKLGGRKHLGEERWKGALTVFDKIYCACIFREDSWSVKDDRIEIIELKNNPVNFLLTWIVLNARFHKSLFIVNWIAIIALRIFNLSWMRRIRDCQADFALCSYGDYDRSDLVYLIAKPVLKCKIVRSYKETRVGYNFLEYETLKRIHNISLYDYELKLFLEKKYGDAFFENSKILLGYDENALPSCILNGIKLQNKLSSQDEKKHIVILSYRVDSTKNRDRDQGRYYYVDTIKELINAGLAVHLHCAVFNNDENGINLYDELKHQHPEQFFVEKPLNMKRDSSDEEWILSCEILSRYDFGLLHNFETESTVSVFDRINVPHRFFAYEAAHVVPIIKKGSNIVLDRMFKDKKCGIVYDNLSELSNARIDDIEYYTPTYEEYLYHVKDM